MDTSAPAEAARHAEFNKIRYAQCWEDADLLVEALRPQPGQTFLSIASAGDNTLALLARGPARVIALDLNPAQLACLELRVAAYRNLNHGELLQLIGSRPCADRAQLYRRCRDQLAPGPRTFWDARPRDIARGIGAAGKFERYFALFRRVVLPLAQSRARVLKLLDGGSEGERRRFYAQHWDNWRWRLVFRIFFSRIVMGWFGRDPSFFRYVEGSVADRILERARYALTDLNPAENPYLQWILTGRHITALPFALRPENFEFIRRHLGALEWRLESLEEFLEREPAALLDGCNLSDIFEYMSEQASGRLLQALIKRCRSGARLVYWNMLAPRSRPEWLSDLLRPCEDEAARLFRADKAFFYSRLIVEEVA